MEVLSAIVFAAFQFVAFVAAVIAWAAVFLIIGGLVYFLTILLVKFITKLIFKVFYKNEYAKAKEMEAKIHSIFNDFRQPKDNVNETSAEASDEEEHVEGEVVDDTKKTKPNNQANAADAFSALNKLMGEVLGGFTQSAKQNEAKA
jgi:hypothetical protein